MSEAGIKGEPGLRAQGYEIRRADLAGWPVRITSYQLGATFRAEIDNVDPGAVIARAEGASREEAEALAAGRAAERLGRTRVY